MKLFKICKNASLLLKFSTRFYQPDKLFLHTTTVKPTSLGSTSLEIPDLGQVLALAMAPMVTYNKK